MNQWMDFWTGPSAYSNRGTTILALARKQTYPAISFVTQPKFVFDTVNLTACKRTKVVRTAFTHDTGDYV